MFKALIDSVNDDPSIKAELIGDYFIPSPGMKVGDSFNPYTIKAKIEGLSFTATVSDIKVISSEVIAVSGREFDCLIISDKTNMRIPFLLNDTSISKSWYCPGYDEIRLEVYDKRNRLESTKELVSIENID